MDRDQIQPQQNEPHPQVPPPPQPHDDIREYVIKLPQHVNYEIRAFGEFLHTLSRIFKNIPFTISLVMINKRILYTVRVSRKYYTVLENQLYSVFQRVEIEEIQNIIKEDKCDCAALATLKLKHGDHYPFLTYEQVEGSFLSDIFNQFNRLTAQDSFFLRVKIKPIDYNRMRFALGRSVGLGVKGFKDRVNIFQSLFSKKATAEVKGRAMAAAQEKNKKPLYQTEIDMLLFSDIYENAYAKLQPIAQTFSKLESDFNEFSYTIRPVTQKDIDEMNSLNLSKNSLHLTSDEVSTFFHFPVNTDAVPNLYKILAPKAEPPLGLPTPDNTPPEELCPFAKTNYRNMREVFGIKRSDRARHMYLIGKSGVGKSKLLELLIKRDFDWKQGVCIIDPHGDLIENIIPHIPEDRIKDVILFNAADEAYPIAFNPIEKVGPLYRQQVATGLIEIFRKIFGANWTPRLEHVLRMTLLALLDAPKASVMSILLLLTDRDYRQNIIKTIEDQVVKNFWTNEFAGWSEKFDSEAIMPILNKIGQFVSNSIIRNIVGQEENKVVMPEIMDNRKILLVKLPKGILGEENTSLLGSMVITKIYQAALARADIPENQRVPFYLYVDEFQNFATDTFSNILSESRKYRLSLTVAHQYVSQLSELIRKTVFGNIGSIISFRLGPEDAILLEQEFEPRFKAADITNLGVREIYLKLSIDEEVKEAFSARTLNMPESKTNFKEQIITHSRQTYCRAREQAEQTLKEEKSKEIEVLEKLKDKNFSAPIL